MGSQHTHLTLGFFFFPAPGIFRRTGPDLFGISADAPPLLPFQAGAVEQMSLACCLVDGLTYTALDRGSC